ncbi:1,3-beta-glucan synthase component bgs4 [Uncinocarpus reesii 1704]|uniref:1,3-beta-glucan synthase component bgs4 n=1 Tax=Uncinocarpus reesii (strain UAMH 1704) TaxID=336963 RepID=C4JSM1_UNCRE|nr:1,3-beta-glucan synthase component bgs4 [Uncinocarpus reesii 1704]EEP80618.1 1,3-beta-glucan synthase component bgs4 [Uncinocarpus reesii 1704]
MAAYPQGPGGGGGGQDQYHDDYSQAHGDAYYQDQGYYDQNDYSQHGDSYYDRNGYDPNQHNSQDGYYDNQYGYQDEYYNDQYYDQGSGSTQWQGYAAGPRRGDSEEDSETFSDFTMKSETARAADMDYYGRGDERYNSYSDSQMGGRGYRPPSSQISYGRSSGASTPVYGDYSNALPPGQRSREPYPAWASDAQIPVSKEEIEDIFLDLVNKFGFQRDSMRNMYDHFMTLLDSRASRMTPNQALLSLHADYIGGDNANYRRWYFAAHLDLDDAVGFANMKLGKSQPQNTQGP